MGIPRRGPLRAAAWLLLLVSALGSAASGGEPSVKKLAGSSDPTERWIAAEMLGRDPTPESARLLAKLLADSDAVVRDEAIDQCERFRSEAAAGALVAAIPRAEPIGRLSIAAGLGRTGAAAVFETLAKLAKTDTDANVRAEAVEALGRLTSDGRVPLVCGAVMRDKDPLVRASAVYAASRLDHTAGREIVLRAFDDKDDGVRAAALAGMEERDREDHVLGAVVDPSWRVRVQCIEIAFALRSLRAVDALVELVGDRRDRVGLAATSALQRLSGKEYGRDPDLWAAWWLHARDTWQRPDGALPESHADDGRGRTRARFMGIEFEGESTAFVIDASGSMQFPAGPSQTRLDLVRKELATTLGAIPDGHRVNVVLFEDRVRAWSETMCPLSARTRAAAIAFANGESPGGATNLLAGVMRALADDDVESICLLSDGTPTSGDAISTNRVSELVRRVNRRRKVAIHVVGVGVAGDDHRAFLQALAADSGGQCVLR